MVQYVYDAWGVCKVYDTNGNVITNNDSVNANPFRYRGYYYDVEYANIKSYLKQKKKSLVITKLFLILSYFLICPLPMMTFL